MEMAEMEECQGKRGRENERGNEGMRNEERGNEGTEERRTKALKMVTKGLSIDTNLSG